MQRLLPALLALALAVPAQADILWFKNGKKLEGKVRQLEDGRYEIVMSFGTLAFEADRIARVESALTLEEIVQQALANLTPDDTESLLELASWCRDHNAETLANRVLRTLLALEPNHPEARRQLGYVELSGRWVTEAEARIARGEVRHDGVWMRPEERERILLRRELERLRRHQERVGETALEIEITRLELEVERARRDRDEEETRGIPLSWVLAGPGHHHHGDRRLLEGHRRGGGPGHAEGAPPAGRRGASADRPGRQGSRRAQAPSRHGSSGPRHSGPRHSGPRATGQEPPGQSSGSNRTAPGRRSVSRFPSSQQ